MSLLKNFCLTFAVLPLLLAGLLFCGACQSAGNLRTNATAPSTTAAHVATRDTRENDGSQQNTTARESIGAAKDGKAIHSAPPDAAVAENAPAFSQQSAGPARAAKISDENAVVDMRVAQAGLADFEMLVESEPAGAQIVVDGLPLAKTPCRLLLNGTQTGFCLADFSVKARFIASGGDARSQSVEELFTRLDKIPAKLRFTATGATRTLAKD